MLLCVEKLRSCNVRDQGHKGNGVMRVCLSVCMSVCMFFIVGQTAGPIGTKLGTQIQLDTGSVLGKSRSMSRSR